MHLALLDRRVLKASKVFRALLVRKDLLALLVLKELKALKVSSALKGQPGSQDRKVCKVRKA